MSDNKKFSIRVVDNKGSWSTEIVRRASARKNVVSKKQGGFSTEEEAKLWGEKELALFLENLKSKNKIRNEQHRENS